MAVSFLLLRCWVGLVGLVATVNALQCFMDADFARRRIYTLQPQEGMILSCCRLASPLNLKGVACG